MPRVSIRIWAGIRPSFQQVYFLLVFSGDLMFRVCQADEWDILGFPIVPKGLL